MQVIDIHWFKHILFRRKVFSMALNATLPSPATLMVLCQTSTHTTMKSLSQLAQTRTTRNPLLVE